jgi:bleomycin hydrolase
MRNNKLFLVPVFIILLIPILINADDKKKSEKKDQYVFTMEKEIKTTPVKDQGKTGTCWSFATTAFIETELIRMNKGEHILSPMWNVRFTYLPKAVNYVRYSGLSNFGMGGQAHDVMNVVKEYGFVPEEIYSGRHINEEGFNNGELDNVLKAIVDAVNKGRKITPVWQKVIEATLNIYLGEPIKEFSYQGKTYTPKSFAESLGFNADDYVEITSYSHHPFYSQFDLEIPDNFTKDKYYNVPMDDLIKIIDNAVMNGYSVAWDGDVSEKEFEKKKNYAIVPEKEESTEADKKDDEEKDPEPIKEKVITQELRQESFDNHTTTDDHLMQITGIAKDQTGARFYYTKNSWGTKDKKYSGYWYVSVPYVQLKTIAIMVHKDAVPAEIKTKLGITK